MQTRLPEGYLMRPPKPNELGAVVSLINTVYRDWLGRDEFSVERYAAEWETPGFNLATDTRVVISPPGEIVGYYELWDVQKPPVRLHCWGRVHPEHSGLGIDTALLEWAEARARQVFLRAPEGARVVLHAPVHTVAKGLAEVLTACGFTCIRHSLRMVIEMNGAPPVANWPAEVQVRLFRGREELPAVVGAVREAFKDHWGHLKTPFEEDLAHWEHTIDSNPDYDPSLWFLAVNGNQIIGTSICWSRTYDDPDQGWVGTLGVRRGWRRKGLGLALLQHSFTELHQRGIYRIGLGVDGSSLTGATRLYEKAGMHPDPNYQIDLYEKELRPGRNLLTQVLPE